ncbi:MAG: hypothetical protein ACJAVS_002463 [Paracoccaceae bacterium]|jgi:hypothetical protein
MIHGSVRAIARLRWMTTLPLALGGDLPVYLAVALHPRLEPPVWADIVAGQDVPLAANEAICGCGAYEAPSGPRGKSFDRQVRDL